MKATSVPLPAEIARRQRVRLTRLLLGAAALLVSLGAFASITVHTVHTTEQPASVGSQARDTVQTEAAQPELMSWYANLTVDTSGLPRHPEP